MTGVTSKTGTAYHSGELEFTPTIYWGSCCSIIVFSVLLDPCLFFSPFSLTIVLSVLRTTTSDYPFGTS